MNTFFNVNWTDVLAVLGSLGLAALVLLLIAYVQLWRERTWRAVNSARQSRLKPSDWYAD